MITAWAVYRDITIRNKKSVFKEQSNQDDNSYHYEKRISDLSIRHQDYMHCIEKDFQELLKQLNDTEAEITVLRREKWQADLQVRAWRHACRDAQQMVWALQRQGCASGTELTRFKSVDVAALNTLPAEL